MTNKEAILNLSFVVGGVYDQVFYGDSPYELDKNDYEALCMAIEALENYDKLAEDLQSCLEMYKKKKSEVETLKQTAWIPCSERLPEKSGRYLVTNTYADDVRIVDFNYWDSEHNWWQTEVFNPDTDKDDFNLAWMPLPKPYMGGEEDGNN